MRNYSKNHNSPENRQKRSDIGRHAVSCRADRQHLKVDSGTVEITEFFELVVRNKITGKETLVSINKGTRANNFTFLQDGKPWKVCGMAKAEGLILSSLAKAQRKGLRL